MYHLTLKSNNMMENVINKVTGFLGGLGQIFLALVPVTVLWYVLTGADVFGMNVVDNLTTLVNSLGNSGFAGLVVLIILWSFFEGRKK